MKPQHKQRMAKDDIESLAYESRNLFLHQIPLAFVVLIHEKYGDKVLQFYNDNLAMINLTLRLTIRRNTSPDLT